MRAHVLDKPGVPEAFALREVPDPVPRDGWVHIRVRAFGLNRSELYTRQGHSGDAVTWPRILGIECVGEVLDGGGTDLEAGQTVAAAMGDMGRLHDGGYAEQTLIPRSNVYPLTTDLDWPTLGALPETYLTAWGVFHEAMAIEPNQTVLIRGGTSSVGLACVSLAKDIGCTVLATTRREAKRQALLDAGVDHVIIDEGSVDDQVHSVVAEGVHGVVELVGRPHTIKDNLLCCRPRGIVGLVGFLGDEWGYEFFPWMPSTVRLTMYSSETLATETATPALQRIVDRVAEGRYRPNIDRVFAFDELVEAHRVIEESRAAGKLVVTV